MYEPENHNVKMFCRYDLSLPNNNCGSINPFFKEHLIKCFKKKQLY